MTDAGAAPPELLREPPAAPPPPPALLELELAPAALAALLRAPWLVALKAGTARGGQFKRTWYDTADGQLAAQGLALELVPTRRGARQSLSRVLPDSDASWLAGTPAGQASETALAEPKPSAEAAGLPAGEALVALAAAEGRWRTLPLLSQGTPVTLSAHEGKLRTVAAETPFARLVLQAPGGELGALLSLAATIGEYQAVLPAWPLAETARALALSIEPRAPRRGAPELDPAMTAEDGFRHALLHLAAVLLWLAPKVAADQGIEFVHQFRVSLRRLRSAFAVWRGVLGGEAAQALDAALRTLAAAASPVRDRDVLLGGLLAETEAGLTADATQDAPFPAAIAELGAAVAAERAAAQAHLADLLQGAGFRHTAFGLLRLAATRGWREASGPGAEAGRDQPLKSFAEAVLERRHRRLVKEGRGFAEAPAAVLHALRLRGKRLRYAAEFFGPLFPGKATRRYLRRLAELQETLGRVNDGAVARQLVRRVSPARGRDGGARAWAQGAVEGFAAAHAVSARAAAEEAWQHFRAADRFWAD